MLPLEPRVGSIDDPGPLGSATAESPGPAAGAANFVWQCGHFSFFPAAASGTFSMTPQLGH
jgi:hypothetical protein